LLQSIIQYTVIKVSSLCAWHLGFPCQHLKTEQAQQCLKSVPGLNQTLHESNDEQEESLAAK
jgi:hypothetical protein